MKIDQSYGIIPLRLQNQEWHLLLVKHVSGHWAFPKGHPNPAETPHQAAERELYEETGLRVQRYLSQDILTEKYSFKWKGEEISKTVHYFMAEVSGNIVLQEIEIQASQWLPLSEAQERMTFPEGKRMCKEIIKIIDRLI